MAGAYNRLRLIERHPVFHPVTQRPRSDIRVFGKRFGSRPIAPAACILERLRQIPVEERDERLDAGLEQRVHQTAVKIYAFLVHLALSRGQQARPTE